MKKFLSFITMLCLVLSLITPIQAEASTLRLSKAKATLEVDATLKLKLGSLSGKKSTWTSSDNSIASVSIWGIVTAKAEGTATITATYNSNKYTCLITVVDSNKESVITVNDSKLIVKGDILYKDNNLTITYQKSNLRSTNKLDVTLIVENNCSDGIEIQCNTATLNGYSFNNIIMSDEVAKGKKGTVEITIANFDSELVDYNKIYELGADFRVMIGGLFSGNDLNISFDYIK